MVAVMGVATRIGWHRRQSLSRAHLAGLQNWRGWGGRAPERYRRKALRVAHLQWSGDVYSPHHLQNPKFLVM